MNRSDDLNNENRMIVILRVILLVAAVVLIVIGVGNGGYISVMNKAIRICFECIGIG